MLVDEPTALGLSSGSFNVTLKNLSRALRAASTGSLFLGYSSSACSYCAVHEPAYAAYDSLARSHPKALPLLARVDADRERALASRHEVNNLPTVVLAFGNRWTPYAGPHTRRAMAAFAATQLAPPSHTVRSEAALQALLRRGAAAELLADEAAGADEEEAGLTLGRQEHELLMLGFFNDPEGEDEEALEDFVAAAKALRRDRPDAAVRAAHVTLSRPLLEEFSQRRRWFRTPPSVVVLVGGEDAPSGGAYNLDERDEDNLDVGAWAARAALPPLGELTGGNFAAYAATGLPMLLGFVNRAHDNGPLRRSLGAVAARYRGKMVVAWCDGEEHKARMLSLGLRAGQLPQLGFNTKDGRQLPFPHAQAPTEAALTRFAASFLGERLHGRGASVPARGPMKVPENWSPRPGDAESVVELEPASFDRLAMDPTRDVLLQLYASEGCEPCVTLVMYFNRLAGRLAELGVGHVMVARLDVWRHQLPTELKGVQLHSLPLLLMLPARRKEPPFSMFHGRARTKELLFFTQQHATHRFELPPNPHLTREQQAAWIEQVGAMPAVKREAAFDSLQRETGLGRAELGLPPEAKEEL